MIIQNRSKLVIIGQIGNIIHEIAEHGAKQAKLVSANHVYNLLLYSFGRFIELDDPDFALIFKTFGIEIPSKLYQKAELIFIKKGNKVFL